MRDPFGNVGPILLVKHCQLVLFSLFVVRLLFYSAESDNNKNRYSRRFPIKTRRRYQDTPVVRGATRSTYRGPDNWRDSMEGMILKPDLRVPEQKTASLSFCQTSPKAFRDWVNQLPMANIGEASRQLYHAIIELNHLFIAPQQRLQLLELITLLLNTI